MGAIKNLMEMFLSPFANKMDDKFDDPNEEIKSKVLPNAEEIEETEIDYNSAFYTLDFDVKFNNIKEAILTYREVASNFEVEEAIDDIVMSAVVDDGDDIINLDLDNIDDSIIAKNTKEKIKEEFDYIISKINFKRFGANWFRRWYIDGRLWAQIILDKNEIKKVKLLSPLDIIRVKRDNKYVYMYKQDERNKNLRNRFNRKDTEFEDGVEIPEKDIAFVPSGLTDPHNTFYISYLHKSIKPLNQLRLLEDSAVIYRITRAPERRVFYIDVGKLPKSKAEQYVKNLMNKFKSSIVYDVKTGKVTQRKNVMTMLEDFYLPSRGDTKGTKVETLQGGTQLGEIEDIRYFKKKLLKSLKVPVSRFDDENQPIVDFGKSGELTRSELKYSKFINRLRTDFSILFLELLRTQLILKNIITIEEFNEIKNDFNFIWESDSYFTEMKESELLRERVELLGSIENYIGKYFSVDWVKKNVLKQTDDEIEEMQKHIEDEKKSGEIPPEEENEDGV